MSKHYMNRRFRPLARLGLAVAVTASVAGCDSFFEVSTPNIINADTVDPVQDGTIFSQSAFQTFKDAFGDMIVYTAWFTNEAWVGDTFPTRNEYGIRQVQDTNGTHNGVWNDLVQGIAQAENVLEILAETDENLDKARAAFTSGMSLVLMGEAFCSGTMVQAEGEPGPEMTPTQLLEVAVERFDQAMGFAASASGGEATNLATASAVGKGRALLQLGDASNAAAAVSDVEDDFVFDLAYVNDPGNRGRLGNGVYFYGPAGSRTSLVVPPHYRDMGQDLTDDADPETTPGDPRIQWYDSENNAQDETLRHYGSLKYPAWDSSIPVASGLQARYIEAEAGEIDIVDFINERRDAGGLDAYPGGSDAENLAELMAQSSIDFWLQGKRMGDWRRNPDAVPNIPESGSDYYKDVSGGVIRDGTCLPLPNAERNANPNIN